MTESEEKMPKMSNETYDFWIWICQIVLPACGTLYTALSGYWGLPYPKEIAGTIIAIDLFLGAVLKISKIQYDKENNV